MIIHRTSSAEEKEAGKPKGLWCGQKVLPWTEAQSHNSGHITCYGCLRKIRESEEPWREDLRGGVS